MKEFQISFDDLMKDEPRKVEIPEPQQGEKVYIIPQDVWENRCRMCVHKNSSENIPVTLYMIEKPWFNNVIPCRIMRLNEHMHDTPGECMNFEPGIRCYGICASCKYDNIFYEGFCMKENHAPQRRVMYGKDYGGEPRKKDYYSRHRFSVCDDYAPDEYARGYISGMEQAE